MRLESDQILWLLGSLCGVKRVPFDAKLILQKYPPPHTEITLVEAARALGFRLGAAVMDRPMLDKLSGPCITIMRPDSGSGDGEISRQDLEEGPGRAADRATQEHSAAHPRLALILRSDGERLLYFENGSNRPQAISVGNALQIFELTCYLVAFDQKENEVADGELPVDARFGFRWFAAELLKYKSIWRNVLAASLTIQLIGLTTPLFTQVILDKVIVHQTQSTLVAIAIGLVMFMLFSISMTWLRQYLIIHTGNRVDAVLGSRVFRHLMQLFIPYFEKRSTGVLVARLHGVETIREFMASAAISLVLDFPFLLVFIGVMFWYSWQLSLIVMAMLGLIAIASAAVTPMLRSRLNQQFLFGARNQAFLTEHISGVETVKALQMEAYLGARYDDYLASYLNAGFATRQLSNSFNAVVNVLEQTMTLLILCAGALLVMRNDGFTIGMLVAFQMFAGRLSQPILRLAGLWQEFQQATLALKRLGDIMNAPSEPNAVVPSRIMEGPARVDLEKVAFRYSESDPFLYENLSIQLRPGKLILLTGQSGSGKSTLAKLLLGFYQPGAGHISIDGRDIRNFAANELRQYYGVVLQETCLFSGTLYENLSAASPHAGFSDIVQACKIAEIHDFIEKLPNGYNTVVGERGVGLSGGEKQRIAIARAVLKRPKILIFDEATSGLDHRNAEEFARTVNQLKGNVTILFIAHQVPKGLEVDEVVRLDRAARDGD